RYYDPESARYLTPDPLGLAPAPNPVAYVHNPHTWSDPLGLAPCRDEDHLFRGTTEWFGASAGTAASGFTPTSTDPGVATAFARHSEQFGDAVVHLIPRSALEGVPLERGFIPPEAEVAVGLPAAELAARAAATIPSPVAREILAAMDIHVPKLNNYGDITDALRFDIPKLTPAQISEFIQKAYEYVGIQ
ncbi:RHS repeat-associated core domain-containing protein, partial [Streptomyces sp.]|uniref:RHS repeat-associated core domain-containing protein n=1 Tax=Streptomyces sp. TaxID=1931 RepID=UPI0028110B6F